VALIAHQEQGNCVSVCAVFLVVTLVCSVHMCVCVCALARVDKLNNWQLFWANFTS